MPKKFTLEESFLLRIVACIDWVPVRLLSFQEDDFRAQWYPFYVDGIDVSLIKPSVKSLLKQQLIRVDISDSGQRVIEITDVGAKTWEEEYSPDWSKFHVQRWRCIDSEIIRVSLLCGSDCCRAAIIGSVVKELFHNAKFGIQEIRERQILNWRATFWKTLPVGYYASFLVSNRYDANRERNILGSSRRSLFFPWGKYPESWDGGG
jgi:hypothetical protein